MATKLIIGVAAVAAIGGAAIGLPWYSAGIAEKQFDAAFAPLASDCFSMAIDLKLDRFDRGLYSSTALTSLVFSGGYEKLLPPVQIEHRISNFPTPARLAKVSSIFIVDGKKIDDIPPVETFLHRDGTFETVWKPGDFDQQSIGAGKAKLTLKNAYIKIDETAQGSQFDFNIDRLQLDSMIGKLAISGVSYKADNPYPNTPICMRKVEGQDVFKIGRIELDAGRLGSAELKDLVMTGVVTDKDNNIDLRSVAKLASVKAAMLGQNFGELSDFVFEMTFSRIPHSALFDIVKKMNGLDIEMFELDSDANYDELLELYKEFGLEFFKNSPEFSVPKLAFTLDTPMLKGTFTASSKYKIDGQADWEAPVTEWLSGEAEAKVSKGLLRSLLLRVLDKEYFVWPNLLLGLDRKASSSPESSSDPDALQQELIAQLLAKSLIVEEANDYKSVFTISRDGIRVNGQSVEDIMTELLGRPDED